MGLPRKVIGASMFGLVSCGRQNISILDPQNPQNVALKLHAHLVQYAYKLVSTRRALEKTYAATYHQDLEWRTATYPPESH